MENESAEEWSEFVAKKWRETGCTVLYTKNRVTTACTRSTFCNDENVMQKMATVELRQCCRRTPLQIMTPARTGHK
jgi:hypothetical protein